MTRVVHEYSDTLPSLNRAETPRWCCASPAEVMTRPDLELPQSRRVGERGG